MTDSTNPLLEREALPPFDRIQPGHVVSAVRSALADSEEKLNKAENSTLGWELIDAVNEIEYEIHRTWGPVTHLMGVQNTVELREAHDLVQKEIVDFYLKVGQSKTVYQTLLELKKTNGKLTKEQRRIVDLRIHAARHAGVGLEGEKKKNFNAAAAELSQCSTTFANHVLDSAKAFYLDLTHKEDIEGLPPSSLNLAAQTYNEAYKKKGQEAGASAEEGPWRITLDIPSYVPFLQYARKRSLREKLYKAFIRRASADDLDNTPLIQKTLELRKKQAQLLGYTNHAEMRMDMRMAKNVTEVYGLMEQLLESAWEPAQKELQELKNYASSCGHKGNIEHWDTAYWSERLREERFGFTEEELRPYFPFPRVLEGLFRLVKEIFDVEVVSADGEAPIWHPDVRCFFVLDEDKNRIAFFYLDPYSRPEDKRGGAWMDDCIGRRNLGSHIELPAAYLVCNAAPPMGGRPALMNFREVETLFHEFGHGLQHMLTKIDHPDIAGINGVEWDAVELPSQFMENWCFHKPCLLSLSSHVETGEPLPDELFEKIKKARTYQAASQFLRQLRFSLIDMDLHYSFDPQDGDSFLQVQKQVDKRTMLIPPLPEDRFLCAFTHIFAGSYAAGYYSYKWAEVLSADAFSAFEEAGLTNPKALKETGRRFRDTILALGGSQPAEEVFTAFRGRSPTPQALLRQAGLAS